MVLPTGQELVQRINSNINFNNVIFNYSYAELIFVFSHANEKYMQGQPVLSNAVYDTVFQCLSQCRAKAVNGTKSIHNYKIVELQDFKQHCDDEYKKGKSHISNGHFDSLVFELNRRARLLSSCFSALLANSFVAANWNNILLFDVLHELENRYKQNSTSPVPNSTFDILAKEYNYRNIFSSGGSFVLPPVVFPSHWSTPISGIDIIEIDKDSQEFLQIEIDLKRSIPNATVFSIKRIQNYGLYRMHYFQRVLMGKMYGRQNHTEVEERTLYHGCRLQDGVDAIIRDGFYRQYCPNGAIGDGCYYALKASYSNNNPYVLNFPDKSKQLFLTRVLVGKSTTGFCGLKQVPANFESVNDGPISMYCIFNHFQAYPEYTIHYAHP